MHLDRKIKTDSNRLENGFIVHANAFMLLKAKTKSKRFIDNLFIGLEWRLAKYSRKILT